MNASILMRFKAFSTFRGQLYCCSFQQIQTFLHLAAFPVKSQKFGKLMLQMLNMVRIFSLDLPQNRIQFLRLFKIFHDLSSGFPLFGPLVSI